jgi:hypothetical protein
VYFTKEGNNQNVHHERKNRQNVTCACNAIFNHERRGRESQVFLKVLLVRIWRLLVLLVPF